MENNVGTAIEKIKLQEQDKEAKLREKREYEATVNSLNRSIREAVFQIEKYQEEIKELAKGNDLLKAKLEIERIKRDAVAAQVEACNKELEALRTQSPPLQDLHWAMHGKLTRRHPQRIVSPPDLQPQWSKRFDCDQIAVTADHSGVQLSFALVHPQEDGHAVQNVADECDVWALLVKPLRTDPIQRVVKTPSDNNDDASFEERLRMAKERYDKAVAERERLLAEPEKGEEFIRIKNALRYSLEMTENLRK